MEVGKECEFGGEGNALTPHWAATTVLCCPSEQEHSAAGLLLGAALGLLEETETQ